MPKSGALPDVGQFSSDARYPFASRGYLVVLGLAILSLLPYGGWPSWTLSILWALRIVQGTMRGEGAMPLVPTGSGWEETFRLWSEGLAVSILVMWPWTLLVLMGLGLRYAPGETRLDWSVGLLVFLSYLFLWVWPAALGLVAAGYGIIGALTPSLIRGVVQRGYAPVLILTMIGGFFFLILNALLQKVPYVGPFLGRFAVLWFEFFLARLLGRAMAEHEERKRKG